MKLKYALLSVILMLSIGSAKAATWTVLYYWAVDNDLYEFSLPYFELLKKIPDSPNVTLVAEYDYPGNRATERILLGKNKQTLIQEIGEKNSADPASLSDFISEGMRSFPADHTILVIGSHGSNWSGIIGDETSKSYMKLEGLRSALRDKKLDLVIFDACKMAFLETLISLKNRVQYFLASPFDVDGFNHLKPLTELAKNSGLSVSELGKLYVDHYPTSLIDDPKAKVSASMISTATGSRMVDDLEHFFGLLNQKTQEELTPFEGTLLFSVSSDGDWAFDLFDVIRKAGKSFSDLSIKAKFLIAKYLMTAKSPIIFKTTSKKFPAHSGLSVTCAKEGKEYQESLAGKYLSEWSKLCEKIRGS